MVEGKSVHTFQINEGILESMESRCGCSSETEESFNNKNNIVFALFPIHSFKCLNKASNTDCCTTRGLIMPLPLSISSSKSSIVKFLNSFHVFPTTVYAKETFNTVTSVTDTSHRNNGSINHNYDDGPVNINHTNDHDDGPVNVNNVNVERQQNVYTSKDGKRSHTFEVLARMYIEKETGRDRVHALFQKNHKGESSTEMYFMKYSVVQIFAISFFIKYIPSWNLARQDFIREHNATQFRTRLDAVRRMSDHSSLKALIDGTLFASKITMFSAGFLFISQVISSYRNKTSVLEYTVAAGITGGLSRLQMGPKGFIAGSFVGTVLGTIFGCVTSAAFHLFNLTEDTRHLQDVISKLEVERSIIGDCAFEEKVQKLTEGLNPMASM